MDPLAEKESGLQLSSILKQHRWPTGILADRGLREVVRRHSEAETIKFLTYNTYLTEAHITLPDPLPDLRLTAKPALHGRAGEIGQRILSEYDFASLYEVMQEQQRNEVLAAWGPSPPDFFFGGTLSSLFTISKKFKIGRREIKNYNNKGKSFKVDLVPVVGPSFDVSLDSDFYAHKGVMLTEIITSFGIVEIFSTHLMFGDGFGKTGEDLMNAAIPFGTHISPSASPSERFEIQEKQIDELIEFYVSQHNKDQPDKPNVAIICGDFNIDGSDPNRPDHQEQYSILRDKFAAIGMKDTWAEGPFINNLAGGQTTRNDDDDTKIEERDFDNICTALATNEDYCDDSRTPNHPPPPDCVGRFDLLFVEEPQPNHAYNLDLSRVRRRKFKWDHPSEGQSYLSDHLGLETTLFVSKK
jgi:hypothetical protein